VKICTGVEEVERTSGLPDYFLHLHCMPYRASCGKGKNLQQNKKNKKYIYFYELKEFTLPGGSSL